MSSDYDKLIRMATIYLEDCKPATEVNREIKGMINDFIYIMNLSFFKIPEEDVNMLIERIDTELAYKTLEKMGWSIEYLKSTGFVYDPNKDMSVLDQVCLHQVCLHPTSTAYRNGGTKR